MKITGKFAAIVLSVLLLGGGVYYFVRPEPPEPAPSLSPEVSALPAVLEGNKLVEKKNGKLVWELEAKTIELDKITGKITLVEVKGAFYRDDGTKLDVTAKTGNFDAKTHDFGLAGDVVALSSDGARLTSDTVQWRQQDEMITAKGKVKLTKPDVSATADEAQTDRALENIRLLGNAVLVKGGNQP